MLSSVFRLFRLVLCDRCFFLTLKLGGCIVNTVYRVSNKKPTSLPNNTYWRTLNNIWFCSNCKHEPWLLTFVQKPNTWNIQVIPVSFVHSDFSSVKTRPMLFQLSNYRVSKKELFMVRQRHVFLGGHPIFKWVTWVSFRRVRRRAALCFRELWLWVQARGNCREPSSSYLNRSPWNTNMTPSCRCLIWDMQLEGVWVFGVPVSDFSTWGH